MMEAVNNYEQEIYESWRRVSSSRQLRLINCMYDVDEGDVRDSYEFVLVF